MFRQSRQRKVQRPPRYRVWRCALVVLTLSAVLANGLGVVDISFGPQAGSDTNVASTCCCAKRGSECRCGSGCCGRKLKLATNSPPARSQAAIRIWISCPQQRPDGLPSLHAPDWLVSSSGASFTHDIWRTAPELAVLPMPLCGTAPPTPPPRVG